LLFKQHDIETLLASPRKDFEVAKSRIFSPRLRKFMTERKRRKHGDYGLSSWSANSVNSPQLVAYLNYLAGEVDRELGIDLDNRFEQIRFPNLYRILALKALEPTVDWKKAKEEKKEILEIFKSKVRTDEHKWLLKQLEHLEGNREARKVSEQIWDLASEYQISLKAYDAFWQRVAQIILHSEIESKELFDEIALLEGWLIEKLVQGEDERVLVEMIEDYGLFEKLLGLSLTRDEYRQYVMKRDKIIALALGDELKILMQESGNLLGLQDFGLSDDTREKLQSFEDDALIFYAGAKARDEAMTEDWCSDSAHADREVAEMRDHPLVESLIGDLFSLTQEQIERGRAD